jgi:endo-beta-N-acetylglucosaminidase D
MQPVACAITSIQGLDSHGFVEENRSIFPFQNEIREKKVLLCHDMAGGYKEDAQIQGLQSADPVYSFQYWALIDIFCYFSHERVTIPPVTWTNAAHINGCLSIGTFIVEWGPGKLEILKLIYGPKYDPELESTQRDFSPHYADRLVEVASFYGFDGYLVNVESSLPSGAHCVVLARFLKYLMRELKRKIPHGIIIWYDSVVNTGALRWQDQLNEKNQMFFDVTDGIFVNYTWNIERLQQSSINGAERKYDIFTGIDVWGRNTFGGGHFNIHRALREIAKFDTSVAIFAPAWTFEFLGPKDFHKNEKRFWVDSSLLIDDVSSSVQKGSAPLLDQDIGCVADYLEPRPISNYFSSNFSRGFGKEMFICGEKVSSRPWIHFSHSSMNPSFMRLESFEIASSQKGWMNIEIDSISPFDGGSCLSIYSSVAIGTHVQSVFFELFKVALTKPYVLQVIYKSESSIRIGFSQNQQFSFPKEIDLKNGWKKLYLDRRGHPGCVGNLGLVFSLDQDLEGDYDKDDKILIKKIALEEKVEIYIGYFELGHELSMPNTMKAEIRVDPRLDQLIINWPDFGKFQSPWHIYVDKIYVGTCFTEKYHLSCPNQSTANGSTNQKIEGFYKESMRIANSTKF